VRRLCAGGFYCPVTSSPLSVSLPPLLWNLMAVSSWPCARERRAKLGLAFPYSPLSCCLCAPAVTASLLCPCVTGATSRRDSLDGQSGGHREH
jgi:hypothetical protein